MLWLQDLGYRSLQSPLTRSSLRKAAGIKNDRSVFRPSLPANDIDRGEFSSEYGTRGGSCYPNARKRCWRNSLVFRVMVGQPLSAFRPINASVSVPSVSGDSVRTGFKHGQTPSRRYLRPLSCSSPLSPRFFLYIHLLSVLVTQPSHHLPVFVFFISTQALHLCDRSHFTLLSKHGSPYP